MSVVRAVVLVVVVVVLAAGLYVAGAKLKLYGRHLGPGEATGERIPLDVVVERARIKQEKVNGKWRDRDVEYFVNYGWNRPDSNWISVRQRGGNDGEIYSAGSAYLIDVSSTPLPEAASANEATCKDWCLAAEGQQQGCRMCSHISGCMPGYRPIKSWKGAGKNWYACEKNKWGARSDANEHACKEWCKGNERCEKCSKLPACGMGLKQLRTFGRYGYRLITGLL